MNTLEEALYNEAEEEDIGGGANLFDDVIVPNHRAEAEAQTTAKPPTTRRDLINALGLASQSEFFDFIKSHMVQPYFRELYLNYIYPAQHASKNKSNQRSRGPSLNDAQMMVTSGEANGQMRYSMMNPDKSQWTDKDHVARYLYHMREVNFNHLDGAFYGSSKTIPEADIILWGLYQYLCQEHTPSRVQRAKDGGVVAMMGDLPKEGKAAHEGSRKPATTTPSSNKRDASPQSQPKPKAQKTSSAATPNTAGNAEETPAISERTAVQPPTQEHDAEGLAPNTSDGHGDENQGPGAEIEPEPKADFEAGASDFEAEESPAELYGPVQNMKGWERELYEPCARRIIVQSSDTPSLKDPYWVKVLMNRVVARSTEIAPDGNDNEGDEEDEEEGEAHEDESEGEAEAASLPTSRPVATEEQPESTFDEWRYLEEEAVDWTNVNLQEGELKTIRPTQASIREFEENQVLFDNTAFQRDNYDEACAKLGIKNPHVPRMPGMRTGTTPKPWQVVGIQALRGDETEGHVLRRHTRRYHGPGEDVVGYRFLDGGMWRFADANPLWQPSTALADYRAEPTPRLPAKPFLIICPPNIVYQWATEIKKVSRQLHPVIYYGDGRDKRSTWDIIDGKLTSKNEHFNDAESNSVVVIVTSYQSLNSRHGPAVLKNHRRNNLKWSEAECQAGEDVPDPSWKHHLGDKFKCVILDEAHIVKNHGAQTATAVRWLKPTFFLCLSATPTPNGILDFKGFEKFLYPDDSDKLWDPSNLRKWNVDPDVIPHVLEAGHPARALMATERGSARYIWDKSIDDTIRGRRMGRLLEECLIRRSLSSRIPFETGNRVGDDIPPSQHKVVRCLFTERERAFYETATKPFYRNLVVKDREGNIIWNNAKLRKLVLMTTWIHFGHVDASVKARDMEKCVALVKEKQLLIRWARQVASAEGLPNPIPDNNHPKAPEAALIFIMRGSPRLRAFLPIITEQVIDLQEKALVFTSFPGAEGLVAAALETVGIKCDILHANLSAKERQTMIDNFNNKPDSSMVLVTSYAVNSAGLNLQKRCRNVHLFDLPLSESIVQQSIGRSRRLGQDKIVKVYEYRVPGSFNTRQVSRNIDKAVPGMIADMDRHLFSMAEDEEGKTVVTNWGVREDGTVTRWTEGEAAPEDVKIVKPDEIIMRIMEAMKGEIMPTIM